MLDAMFARALEEFRDGSNVKSIVGGPIYGNFLIYDLSVVV